MWEWLRPTRRDRATRESHDRAIRQRDVLLAPRLRATSKCQDTNAFTLRFLKAVAVSIVRRNLTHQLQLYGAMPNNCNVDRLTQLLHATVAAKARAPTLHPRWLIFFLNDDYGGPLPLELHRHIILRTSMDPPFDDMNVHVMPYMPYDVSFPPQFAPKPRGRRNEVPVVGFCGAPATSAARKSLLQAIRVAETEQRVKTLFVMRQMYNGGSESDFNDNLHGSHFVVASRGRGNFAMRLYQAMAAGRIPVLTRPENSMRLPLENVIPWGECLVQAPSDAAVVRRMLDIWNAGTDVERRQRRCATLYREWFNLDEPGGAGYVEELVAQLGANTSAEGSIYARAFGNQARRYSTRASNQDYRT